MMTDYTLHIPEDIYHRAAQKAVTEGQSVDKVLLDHLQSLTLPNLSSDEEKELEALKALSDDALKTIAREQMPGEVQDRMHWLMDRNTQGTITPTEYDELASYVERGSRVLLRKAEAAYLLQARSVAFTQEDFRSGDA